MWWENERLCCFCERSLKHRRSMRGTRQPIFECSLALNSEFSNVISHWEAQIWWLLDRMTNLWNVYLCNLHWLTSYHSFTTFSRQHHLPSLWQKSDLRLLLKNMHCSEPHTFIIKGHSGRGDEIISCLMYLCYKSFAPLWWRSKPLSCFFHKAFLLFITYLITRVNRI